MYFYVKIRKIGTLIWKAVRDEKGILIFKKYDLAKKYALGIENTAYKIVTMDLHPSNRQSCLYGKKYKIA